MYLKRKIAAALSVVALLTSGCMVGPDFTHPGAFVSEDYTQIEDEGVHKQLGSDLAEWWESINDPVLSELIYQTVGSGSEMGGSLTLQEMAWRVQQARARLGITTAELFPQIQEDGSYVLSKHSENQTGNPEAARKADQDWNLGMSMAWEVDVFGRLKRYTESASAEVEEMEELYYDAYIILLSDVAKNYVQARTLQEQIDIAKKNIIIRRDTLKLTETMMEVGKSNALDVSQARGSLESVEAELPNLEASYRAAVNRLSVLTGNPPGYVDEVMAEVRPVPKAPENIMVGIPMELLRRRPDIRAAERALVAQNAMIGAAMGDLYPIFTLNGNFGVNGANLGDMFEGSSTYATVTPAFRWNILNFGRYQSNVRLQEYIYQEDVAKYRQTVLLAAEEVDNSLSAYVKGSSRVKRLQAAMEAYDNALDVSETRYREGKADFQRVLDSQREKLTYELAYIRCKAEITNSVIDLYRALGGGWTHEQGNIGNVSMTRAEDPTEEETGDSPITTDSGNEPEGGDTELDDLL
ncbi:MAG: efflux transporter outer membrane subunit [Thermoguttaceae bacterium]|nr:efflux transporter outer membrane subunit [Thermoguttaceae bacterium]